MRKISKIEPTMSAVAAKKKVAGYARISMESERMHHSLSAQISYYNALIQKKPEWEFAGVYADDGISGTGTAKRSEFLRMIADCEAGKIDIILTKSIQRFARNTVDLLETVRHFHDFGFFRFYNKVIAFPAVSVNLKMPIRNTLFKTFSRTPFHIFGN